MGEDGRTDILSRTLQRIVNITTMVVPEEGGIDLWFINAATTPDMTKLTV
jgi:hypothetical protein